MDPTVFGCIPASQPPFSSLSPPGFTRLWHPTDFVTLWFLAGREEYQGRVSISSGKELSESMRRRLWEHKQAFLCLLELVFLYFPYLVCLLGSYIHLANAGVMFIDVDISGFFKVFMRTAERIKFWSILLKWYRINKFSIKFNAYFLRDEIPSTDI